MIEKTTSQKMLHDGKFLKFVHHEIEIENDPPIKGIRQFILHPGGVCVLAITKENKIVLVEQYRKPVEQKLLEIPAGKIDPGEETLITAKRELQEETGYSAQTWVDLGQILPCPGYSNEILYLYLAKDLTHGQQNLDHGEIITCHELEFNEIREMIVSNQIQDAKTISALFIAEKYINEN
jgi:ADP-ribose pyrophosphatase